MKPPVETGSIRASGATIIIDNLTNDVRGTRARPAIPPWELVRRVDQLRGRMRAAGATAVVVCQIKPMKVTDVTPYNVLLDDYLRAQVGGYGC